MCFLRHKHKRAAAMDVDWDQCMRMPPSSDDQRGDRLKESFFCSWAGNVHTIYIYMYIEFSSAENRRKEISQIHCWKDGIQSVCACKEEQQQQQKTQKEEEGRRSRRKKKKKKKKKEEEEEEGINKRKWR
jgi:hypothetical protein